MKLSFVSLVERFVKILVIVYTIYIRIHVYDEFAVNEIKGFGFQ